MLFVPAALPLFSSPRVSLACLLAAVALAGCGGGGGGGDSGAAATPAPTPTPAPVPGPAPAASYHVAAISSSDIAQDTVQIIDPATAGIVLSVPIAGTAALVTSVAGSVNAGSRSVTLQGEPLAFFIQDQQLFQVALAKPGTPAAVRISSAADVCRFDSVVPLNPSGLDVWLVVGTAGADGDCNTATDNRQALVRSGSAVSTAATVLPAGVTTLAPAYIADNSGQLLWIPAIDKSVSASPKLVAYKPDLTRVDVAGGAGVASASVLNFGASLSDGVYLRADSSLRRLTGDASSLSLAAANYSFGSTITGFGVIDGGTVYFADGPTLLKVQGAAAPTPLATLPAGAGNIFTLVQSATTLLAQQSGPTGVVTTSAVHKTSAVAQTLFSSSFATGQRTPVGLSSETLYYSTGNGSTLGDLRRMQTDGSGDTLVTAGIYTAGGISRSTVRADYTQFFFAAPVAALLCKPAAGAADCRGGSLIQYDLAAQTSVTLGSFSGSSTAPAWTLFAQGQQGLAGGIASAFGTATPAVPGYSRRDIWLFTPGQANSLVRATSNMP